MSSIRFPLSCITIISSFFILSNIFISCNHKHKNEIIIIPKIKQVGKDALPDSIAKIKAPFEIINFKKPSIKQKRILITDHIHEKDSILTPIINNIIDSVSSNGGGIIVITDGKWKSGRIILKNNIELHLNDSAEIHFTGNVEDYLPVVKTRIEGIELMSLGACIYANSQKNILITGNGKLFGPSDGPVRSKMLTDNIIDNAVLLNKPVEKRIYDGKTTYFLFSPMFISPINCQNVYIEGVSLQNTAFWNIVPIYCKNVIIRGVSVNSVGIPRGDGVDIESSKNVLIEYCTLSCGDDCFTMKAGRGTDGLRVNKPTENVVVRYCLAKEGHGGISCGSETAGTIRNLYVHDCVFENTGVGIRFKTRRSRGGGGENLFYERIRMNLRYSAIKWDMLGSVNSVGELAHRLPEKEINELTPSYKNISINNLIIENCDHFLKIFGIPESPVENLNISNSEIISKQFIIANDVKNVKLHNLIINTNDSIINLTDCRDFYMENIIIKTKAKNIYLKQYGSKSKNINCLNCKPPIKQEPIKQ
ncbi:MAG: hypothetical protein JW717_00715 [Marinilabiliaceae bacterium]|nr:hypothetical protein [Marinilabiliaceae bacterium]